VVRKGFRRRLPLYAVYFTGINLSWWVLAMVFDQREIISYLWRGVPLGIFLLAIIELTMDLKVPDWYKRWKIPYILFWGSFLLAMVIWFTTGYWWMSIPIVCLLLLTLSRNKLKSLRTGKKSLPPPS
jgi:hypothetical protein